jgi:hypothetical protein
MEFMLHPHLRVHRPVTSDGINPVIGTDGRPVQKIVHLPLTARQFIERKNTKLPQHLKVKIEEMPGMVHQPFVDTEKEELKAQVKEFSGLAKEVEEMRLLIAKLQLDSTQKPANEKAK